MARKHTMDLLDRLAAAEEQFLRGEFLAPMVRGGRVHVRIAGVVCRLKVRPARFVGWGVFRPTAADAARLVRPASLRERQAYLDLLPRGRLILSRKAGEAWLGLPAHQGDRRLPPREVPVFLVEEGQAFETVGARFDGAQCWYEGPDTRNDPARAAYLRDALAEMVEPGRLRRPGLTRGERDVYARAYERGLQDRRDRAEVRLREALEHAGAEFRTYAERDDGYRVEFSLDGRRHVSVVSREDFQVRVAGVCLSGEDRKFDLQSLVGILRQADGVLRVGPENEGIEEGEYWRVHPPPA